MPLLPIDLRARLAPALRATLSEVVPLRYRTAQAGLLPHVRGASALCHWGSRLVIVQDDVQALALLDQDGQIDPLVLPGVTDGVLLFDDAHGNKKNKLDLESALCLPDGRLLAFGSGATSRRERIVVLGDDSVPRIVDASELYAVFRAERSFSGIELNIEGAVVHGQSVRFFQRATGARAALQMQPSAIGDVSLGTFVDWLDRKSAVPQLTAVRRVDLGETDGIRYGFTDATPTLDGRIAFLACAENSADAVSDGPVLGCRFGLIAGEEILIADVVDVSGHPINLKLEGIASRPDDPTRYDVVADQDLPDEPALLGQIRITAS